MELVIDIRWVVPGCLEAGAKVLEVKYGRIEDGRIIETTNWITPKVIIVPDDEYKYWD